MTTAEKIDSYDYIVIGAGSAGCIAAARLAEKFSVLLLEAGDSTDEHPETLSADGFKTAFANDQLMWQRMTTSQQQCGGRSLYAGSGRGMGGSGSVNGMVYTRGDRHGFEAWPKSWQWEDVSRAFEAVEEKIGIQSRPATPFAQRFIDACEATGFKRKDGMNDGDLTNVVGCNDMNFSGEERRSSYAAWLHNDKPGDLTIETNATASRIVFDDELRATGVEYRQQGKTKRAEIRKELALCAGALETPKLLMISGIGPEAELKRAGIEPLLDSPGVGKNLQDHPNVCLFYRAKSTVDFKYPQIYAFGSEAMTEHGKKQNPNTCFVCYAAPASIKESMLRMVPILALPGSLYHLKPLRKLLRGLIHMAFKLLPVQHFVGQLFGIVVILGKPESRGEITLKNSDPNSAANIDLGYFNNTKDQTTLLAGMQKARAIAKQKPFQEIHCRPLSAGAKTIPEPKLIKWLHSAAMTTFHYCGSCRMGADRMSPVDEQLRVKGLANVRVADASVIPEIPVSALNAPSMMIGYRAADFILDSQTT